jgi:hypothetical protein
MSKKSRRNKHKRLAKQRRMRSATRKAPLIHLSVKDHEENDDLETIFKKIAHNKRILNAENDKNQDRASVEHEDATAATNILKSELKKIVGDDTKVSDLMGQVDDYNYKEDDYKREVANKLRDLQNQGDTYAETEFHAFLNELRDKFESYSKTPSKSRSPTRSKSPTRSNSLTGSNSLTPSQSRKPPSPVRPTKKQRHLHEEDDYISRFL